MKTIFITIFQGVEFRNLVRGQISKILASEDNVRLVLFANSKLKKEYYEKEFSGPNIIYEVVEGYKSAPPEKIFWHLKFNLINTSTIDIKRKQQLRRDGVRGLPKYLAKLTINRLFAHRPFRKIVRALDWRFVDNDFFGPYFKKYNPSVVLMAHLFSDLETSLLRSAKKRGVRTIGLINSWDKLTARCMLRLLPDKMLVHNQLVLADTIKYTDMSAKDIIMVGIPHFDHYIRDARTPREDFFTGSGIGEKDKVILFCPAGTVKDLEAHAKNENFYGKYSDPDTKIISLLDNLITEGAVGENVKLIVRYPPNDNVNVKKGYKTNILFQVPGKRFTLDRGQDWDMDENDFRELANTLHYSDVVLTYPSTMVIDAASFGKPVINLDIDFPNTPKGFLTWFYDVDHYQPILKTKAVRLAKNKEAMVNWIKKYLADPQIDSEERKELVRLQCAPFDGRAGERVANFILNNV